MLTSAAVALEVRKFIISNFLYGQDRSFKEDDSFMGEGIVDSTGVLQLVAFLEETYGITVEDEEMIPENLDSISNVSAYLVHKMSSGVEASISLQESARGGNA
jgi:acyl carrier protein